LILNVLLAINCSFQNKTTFSPNMNLKIACRHCLSYLNKLLKFTVLAPYQTLITSCIMKSTSGHTSYFSGNFLYRNVLPAPPPPAPPQVRQGSELMSPYGFLPIQPTFSLPHIFQPEPTSPWAQLSAAQASTVFQIPDCHGKASSSTVKIQCASPI
jgi:hypothetical protein